MNTKATESVVLQPEEERVFWVILGKNPYNLAQNASMIKENEQGDREMHRRT